VLGHSATVKKKQKHMLNETNLVVYTHIHISLFNLPVFFTCNYIMVGRQCITEFSIFHK